MITEKIDKLFNEYNNAIKQLDKSEESLLKQFSQSVVEKKILELKQDIKHKFLNEGKKLLDEVSQMYYKILIENEKDKYPLRYSDDINKKLLGEMIYKRAFDFVKNTKNKDAWLKEIILAAETNETDYLNSLIEIIDSEKPSDAEILQLNEADRYIYDNFNSIKEQIRDKYKMADRINDLQLLKIHEKELKGFDKFVQDEQKFYMPPRIAGQKTQEEMNEIFSQNENPIAAFEYTK